MDFGEKDIKNYDHLDMKKNMGERHGKQAGDPKKGAQAFYDLAVMRDPPLRCIVGTDAYSAIQAKLKTYKESVEKYKEISNSTDVDGYKAPS
jgi:hypothetical protein